MVSSRLTSALAASVLVAGCGSVPLRVEVSPALEQATGLSPLLVAAFEVAGDVPDGHEHVGDLRRAVRTAIRDAAPGYPVVRYDGPVPGEADPTHDESRTRPVGGSILVGRLLRWEEREGNEIGVTRPATVWFEVTVRAPPDGEPLWRARFAETQRPLSDDLGNVFRYPGHGTRWLTADELARWGARAVAEALVEDLGDALDPGNQEESDASHPSSPDSRR